MAPNRTLAKKTPDRRKSREIFGALGPRVFAVRKTPRSRTFIVGDNQRKSSQGTKRK